MTKSETLAQGVIEGLLPGAQGLSARDFLALVLERGLMDDLGERLSDAYGEYVFNEDELPPDPDFPEGFLESFK